MTKAKSHFIIEERNGARIENTTFYGTLRAAKSKAERERFSQHSTLTVEDDRGVPLYTMFAGTSKRVRAH